MLRRAAPALNDESFIYNRRMGRSLTFSVGIPAYNQGEFLEETILSLLNQTRPPDEIVVSDHHSTDSTPDVIAKYAKHLRAVKPPEGTNLTAQYNFTLASQTGDWITLLSSDDLARPNFCEVLMRGAASVEDAVLVRAGWENIDAEGKHVSLNYFLRAPRVERPPATLISQAEGPRVSFAAFALKREAYEASGPILGTLESLADWALFVQMAPFGAFVRENELISGYRVGHDGDKFRRRLPMWVRDEQRMFTEVFPLAAQRAGIQNTAWIAAANKSNFMRYLTSAQKLSTEDRVAAAAVFEPWARSIGSEDLLRRFSEGRPLPRSLRSVLNQGRNLVRPFAQRLRAGLDRR
jgi:glycosyltransferase involved in cell wall biosynthesis